MSERISLVQLRAIAERGGFAAPKEIRALVEAVEAACEVYDDPGAAFPWNRLNLALARFDWERP